MIDYNKSLTKPSYSSSQNGSKTEAKLPFNQIALTVIGLLLFGAIEVFSASRYQGIQLKGNLYYFGLIHLAFVIGSIVIIAIASLFNTKIIKTLTPLAYVGLLVSLVAVFFFDSENGSHRWIPLGGTGFTIQPSEFAKLISILMGAHVFSQINWNQDKTYGDHVIRFIITSLPVFLIMGLVLIEPDLGNVVVIAAAYLTMYLLSDNKWKKSDVWLVGVVAVLVGIVAVVAEPYRMTRIITHLQFIQTGTIQDEFGDGLQLRNILIGVGSGGIFGKGIGESRLKQGYFVEVTAFTDSISAVVFEELGFLLSLVFIGVYIYLFLLMIKVAEGQKHQYQRLIMWGIAMWFIVQSFMHFGANVALIPVKGTTLPFISYGGSSMFAFAAAIGITLHLARHASETA